MVLAEVYQLAVQLTSVVTLSGKFADNVESVLTSATLEGVSVREYSL